MAKNDSYHATAYSYALRQGLDRVDAEAIATVLSVQIPMIHHFGEDEEFERVKNAHVVEQVEKLRGATKFPRIWPYDLMLEQITVENYDDLPPVTTYGQTYFVKSTKHHLETQEDGFTRQVKRLAIFSIGDQPFSITPEQLADLNKKVADRGMQMVVTDRKANDPLNIDGINKMMVAFAREPMALLKAESEAVRDEQRSGWSRPADTLKFRKRPSSQILRMQRRGRRG